MPARKGSKKSVAGGSQKSGFKMVGGMPTSGQRPGKFPKPKFGGKSK